MPTKTFINYGVEYYHGDWKEPGYRAFYVERLHVSSGVVDTITVNVKGDANQALALLNGWNTDSMYWQYRLLKEVA
jgi:hypothetical protein